MKNNNLIDRYGQQTLTVLFAVAVFFIWQMRLPFLMLAREQSQLFLWNVDYFMERLLVPGGFAQYLSEFIVQFFINPVYGAVWYVVLLVGAQMLTWNLFPHEKIAHKGRIYQWIFFLLSFVPSLILWYLACRVDVMMTLIVAVILVLLMMNILPSKSKTALMASVVMIPLGYWLVGSVVVLLPIYLLRYYWSDSSKLTISSSVLGLLVLLAFCIVGSSWIAPYSLKKLVLGVDYTTEAYMVGTYEEMECDMYVRSGQWQKVLTHCEKNAYNSLAIQNAVILAKFKLQEIDNADLSSSLSFEKQSMKNQATAFLQSEVTLQIGMINISQRAAFEAMEAARNCNKSGRALYRLALTNLVTGQYDVALKYISILEHTLFYRSRVQEMKELALHPQRLKNVPYFRVLMDIHNKTTDHFFF
jgi:hypothetical protein